MLLNDAGVFQSELLNQLPWVTHGFGSRLSGSWPGEYTNLKQIHTDQIVVANGGSGCIAEGDALICSNPGTLIGIRTADCVPMLFADSERQAVAAIHAGWRGTVAEIAGKTIERMRSQFGSSPDKVYAVIGPAIGKCCFEVGPEVSEQFGDQKLTHIDLVEANFRQLRTAGVSAGHIDVAALCTRCDGARFHSFRRDKQQSGRMVAAIGINPVPKNKNANP